MQQDTYVVFHRSLRLVFLNISYISALIAIISPTYLNPDLTGLKPANNVALNPNRRPEPELDTTLIRDTLPLLVFQKMVRAKGIF